MAERDGLGQTYYSRDEYEAREVLLEIDYCEYSTFRTAFD